MGFHVPKYLGKYLIEFKKVFESAIVSRKERSMTGIGNLFANEDVTDIDQTIRWARESFQRRRNELNTKTQDQISSSAVGDNTRKNDSELKLNDTLDRGRVLITEAEACSKILEHYAGKKRFQTPPGRREPCRVPSKIHDASLSGIPSAIVQYRDPNHGRDLVGKFINCTDLIHNELQVVMRNGFKDDPLKSLTNIPSEKPNWDVLHCCKVQQSTSSRPLSASKVSTHDNYSFDLDNLIFEGEARARLDTLIASMRVQGEQSLKIMSKDDSSQKKQLSSFDPTSMRAAKRAAVKDAKRAEESFAAEEEYRRMSLFKARPLPSGVKVTSNIHAPTLAFQNKQIGTVDRLLRKDSNFIKKRRCPSSLTGAVGGFDDVSVVTSRSSNWSAFSFCGGNKADKDRASKFHFEKSQKKGKILAFVNQFIILEKAGCDDSSLFSKSEEDLVEDELSLHQQIGILEAKLRREKYYGRSILNDIVDIDQNVIIENIICGGSQGSMKTTVNWLKEKFCDPIEAWKTDDLSAKLSDVRPRVHAETEKERKRSLHRRDEDWIKERERRRLDALTLREEIEMTYVTGKPQISCSKESWAIAKKSHQETLKKAAEEEAESRKRKEKNERIASEIKMKEISRIKEQIKSKSYSKQTVVSKEEQKRRVDKLSQPKQIIQAENAHKKEQPTKRKHMRSIQGERKLYFQTNPKDLYKSPAPNIDYLSSQNERRSGFTGKRFSDMNDKEFEKMLKRINQNVKSLKCTTPCASESSLTSEFKRDACNSPEPSICKLKENGDAYDHWEIDQFCSSSAQERLMRKFNIDIFNEAPLPNAKRDPSNKMNHADCSTSNSFKKVEPYEKYEQGGSLFDCGPQLNDSLRLRVRDARSFSPDTVYKIPYQAKAGEKGVSLLVGKMVGGDDELVITIIFDTIHFDESSAALWWDAHKERFITVISDDTQ